MLLVIHPKLTGKILIRRNKSNSNAVKKWIKDNFIRAYFMLNDNLILAFSDVRKFGKIIFGKRERVESLPDLRKLGIEALDKNLTTALFFNLLKKRKQNIKQVLLNQEVIAGIGNIYSDEALWLAGLNPLKPANKIMRKES